MGDIIQARGEMITPDTKPRSMDFEPIPRGEYTVVIVEAEIKTSRDGGKYLNMRFDVVAPSCEGRALFDVISLLKENSDPVKAEKSRKISAGRLVALCLATKIGKSPNDINSSEFVGRMMKIKVGIEYDDYKKADVNKVLEYVIPKEVKANTSAPAPAPAPAPVVKESNPAVVEEDGGVPGAFPWEK